jgi:hypothetical protein
MPDFAEIARPYLDGLSDDPDGPPKIERVTTSPVADYLSVEPPALDDVIFVETLDGEVPLSGLPGLGPVDVNAVAAAQSVFREVGVDALAFYKSFRFKDRAPYPGKWGVFLIDAGIMAVAKEFRIQWRPPTQHEAERLAFQTLLQHERYHFWIDVWALGQEILPFAEQRKRYEYYLQNRPVVELTEADDEESLANFYAIQRLRRVRLADGSPATRLVRRFFAECPVPYSLFDLDARRRASRERHLAGAVANGLYGTAISLAGIDAGAHDIGQVLARGIRPPWFSYPFAPQPLCPTYLVRDRNYAARVQPFQGPDRTEFKRFLESYLAGQELQQTDHLFYKIDNGEKIKFPNDHEKEIRGYELKNVLLKAGMRHAEFRQARQDTKGWKKGCPRPEAKQPLWD